MPAAELAATLEYRSGLHGLSGTGDMREVPARASARDERAELAREVYLHRLRGCVAGMAAAMDGLDVLVFTVGVGEISAEIRSRAMHGLGFLGIREDTRPNTAGTVTGKSGCRTPRSAAWSSGHARTSRSPARYGQHCNHDARRNSGRRSLALISALRASRRPGPERRGLSHGRQA